MLLHQTTRRNALLVLALAGTLGVTAPAFAQNAGKADENPHGQGEKGTMSNPGATGVGQRGTKVAPSTNPAQSGPSASTSEAATGTGKRGTKSGPSTQPPASGQTQTR